MPAPMEEMPSNTIPSLASALSWFKSSKTRMEVLSVISIGSIVIGGLAGQMTTSMVVGGLLALYGLVCALAHHQDIGRFVCVLRQRWNASPEQGVDESNGSRGTSAMLFRCMWGYAKVKWGANSWTA